MSQRQLLRYLHDEGMQSNKWKGGIYRRIILSLADIERLGQVIHKRPDHTQKRKARI